MIYYPEAFGKFVLDMIAKGKPVVVVPQKEE